MMPADPWEGFRLHRIVRAPARDREVDEAQHEREVTSALLAAIGAVHSDLRATGPEPELMAAWVRPPGEAAIRILVGGRPRIVVAASPGSAEAIRPPAAAPISFPPGAFAEPVELTELRDLIDRFRAWTSIVGASDSLWLDRDQHRAISPRGSFERQAAHLGRPFAWVVRARPMESTHVEWELQELVNELIPMTRGELSESRRVELERKQARHRELARLRDGGFWRISVQVGGVDEAGALTAAALLATAAELDGLPYSLTPGARVDRADPFAGARYDDASDDGFTGSGELLAALVRPPRRELAGIRLVQRHTFDVTPERAVGGIPIGEVIDDAESAVGEASVSLDALNRHTFVCGATGGGKSMTVRHLLEQASERGIPWLVIEPAKAEYARMAGRLGAPERLVVIRPGDPDAVPVGFNPLEPEPGFPLQTHVDLLRALFLAAFEAHEPLPQILATALKRSYEELGWDLTVSAPVHDGAQPRYPTLGDLQRVAETVVDEVGYGKEVADNVRGFIRVRISSLRLGTTGRFFEGGHRIDFGAMYNRNVVLEIEDVGDDADKAFFMGAVLMRVTEHLRRRGRSMDGPGLSHLTVIEEAHRLLRRPDPTAGGAASHAVETFASLLAEVRAYGEGLIIAEQIPSKLIPDVIKNTSVKIVHRLPAADDRDAVGATMNLDPDQSRFLVTLPAGQAALFADGMDRPMLVRVRNGEADERREVTSAEPATLADRRFGVCGMPRVDESRRLRDIRSAEHLLEMTPWLRAWAELTVMTHVLDQPAPAPREDELATMGGVPPWRVRLALVLAVDDAVAVRSASIDPGVPTAEFAAHVVGAVLGVLNGGPPCTRHDGRYRAVGYRWDHVAIALGTWDGDAVHPRTAEWEAAYGRPISGRSRIEQLTTVYRYVDEVRRRPSWEIDALLGVRRPSHLGSLVGRPDRGDDRTPTLLAPFRLEAEAAMGIRTLLTRVVGRG